MAPGDLPADTVLKQLNRILASPGFSRNERLSRFLRFVVEQHLEGRDAEIKESLIAVEAFGRKPDYDPKEDSIVRSEAARLRARLAEYYASEGSGDQVVIELPKGRYTPHFRQVEKRHDRRGSRSQRFWPWVALACAALLLLVIGLRWVQSRNSLINIAVLPLENVSQDPASDYFADGLTDEIIRNLAVIDGLSVRSRTSSFALKGKPRNVREMARQLDADYILEGSVLRAGQQLRVNIQLVRTRDDFALWSGRFDRELTDIFSIQDEISRGIVNNLRLTLGQGRRRYETSIEAYDLYLRARALPYQKGLPGWVQSIQPFEEVIATDASFAPAYAGLARAYSARSTSFMQDHPADELTRMRAAAEKAIQLDPLLAEAYDALGTVYAREGQWKPAEESFRKAIDREPSLSVAYTDFAINLLMPLGRTEEAIRQLRLSEKVDPLSEDVQRGLAFALISAGRYDEAVEHCQKMAAEDGFKNQFLGRARLGQGRIEEAIHLLAGDVNQGFVGWAYARSGRRDEAEKLAAANGSYPNRQAVVYAGLGDKDRAFEALERMGPEGPGRIGQYLNYPELSILGGDPRLKALRKKVGLPE